MGGIDLAGAGDFAMYSVSKEGVVSVYLPDTEFWIAAVKNGELEGRVENEGFFFPGSCTVTSKRDKVVAFLKKHQKKCFDSAVVFSLTPRKDKP